MSVTFVGVAWEISMDDMTKEFARRANRIPSLGIGLSVDVYSPDVFDLLEVISTKGLSIDYLEIFQASRPSLKKIRSHLPSLPLAYHAEGIWVTQPDWKSAYYAEKRLSGLAQDLGVLKGLWVNQECASKEMVGRTFGTYLPPVFSEDSAHVTAWNSYRAQQCLDDLSATVGCQPPLFCLEGPPLSYFSCGNLSYPEFFARIIQRTPCGLVLDLGHAWTVFRYAEGEKWENLQDFFENFLQKFPLERVIQIHLAGLSCHSHVQGFDSNQTSEGEPLWVDAHEAPIPLELWEMLVRVLDQPRLTHLKGVALEVDNKSISLICQELTEIQRLVDCGKVFRGRASTTVQSSDQSWEYGVSTEPFPHTINQRLFQAYEDYVRWVAGPTSGRGESSPCPGTMDCSWEKGQEIYTSQYLPHEILRWGGDIQALFPQGCQLLTQQGVSLGQFVEFWLSQKRSPTAVYDFFLIKIAMFEEFFASKHPGELAVVQREAAILREGYAEACAAQ